MLTSQRDTLAHKLDPIHIRIVGFLQQSLEHKYGFVLEQILLRERLGVMQCAFVCCQAVLQLDDVLDCFGALLCDSCCSQSQNVEDCPLHTVGHRVQGINWAFQNVSFLKKLRNGMKLRFPRHPKLPSSGNGRLFFLSHTMVSTGLDWCASFLCRVAMLSQQNCYTSRFSWGVNGARLLRFPTPSHSPP